MAELSAVLAELHVWHAASFVAAGARQTSENVELEDEVYDDQELECLLCGEVFLASLSDARNAVRNQVYVCPEKHPHPVEGPVTAYTVVPEPTSPPLQDRITEALEAFEELTLGDLAELVTAPEENPYGIYRQVRTRLHSMAKTGQVCLERRTPKGERGRPRIHVKLAA